MTTIYHNPRCTKSRQTLALLEKKDKNLNVVEYLKDTPDEKDIKSLLSKLKINAEDLVRKSESIYKEKFKGKVLTEQQWISTLAKYPILIERPIVVRGNKAVIGRPPENIKQLY